MKLLEREEGVYFIYNISGINQWYGVVVVYPKLKQLEFQTQLSKITKQIT